MIYQVSNCNKQMEGHNGRNIVAFLGTYRIYSGVVHTTWSRHSVWVRTCNQQTTNNYFLLDCFLCVGNKQSACCCLWQGNKTETLSHGDHKTSHFVYLIQMQHVELDFNNFCTFNDCSITISELQPFKFHLIASSVPVNFFLPRGHAIFQGGCTKYSTLIYKSNSADCHFRPCWVR